MSLFNLFRNKPNSAQKAKERLQIIIAHQRDGRESDKNEQPAFMEEMKAEILKVVRRYIQIEPEDVSTDLTRNGNTEVLGLTINLADKSQQKNNNNPPPHNQAPKNNA